MGRMYVFTAHESRYSHREPWIGAGRPGRRHRRCGIDHDRQYRRQLPVWIGQCDSSTGNGGFSISLSGTQARGAGLVEGLQHEYPGYRLSDTHPWRQPEYLADRHRRQHWHQLFHLCRLAEYPVRTGEDRRRRRQRSADARGIRPHPGPGRSEQTLPHRHVGLGPSSAPPAASMRARRTSPCRSARSTAMRSRAWARRWPSETSRSGSTAMPCRRDKETRS